MAFRTLRKVGLTCLALRSDAAPSVVRKVGIVPVGSVLLKLPLSLCFAVVGRKYFGRH